jgi:hypothetical protein
VGRSSLVSVSSLLELLGRAHYHFLGWHSRAILTELDGCVRPLDFGFYPSGYSFWGESRSSFPVCCLPFILSSACRRLDRSYWWDWLGGSLGIGVSLKFLRSLPLSSGFGGLSTPLPAAGPGPLVSIHPIRRGR